MKKISYLGAGAWGFCLARLLAQKGFEVVSWTIDEALAEKLTLGYEHPNLKGVIPHENMTFTTSLEETLKFGDVLIESVTSKGIRPVFEQVKQIGFSGPVIITSKGIEQKSGLTLPEVLSEMLGDKNPIGLVSGPSFAEEVVRNLPTSVVASSYDVEISKLISELFTTETFRVYPNSDILGVAYGGALKNIIAIACGISDGLNLGLSSRAALITRGLHEMGKIAKARGCKTETINGLSGLGDVVLTASSLISRNFKFGHLLAQGVHPEEAKKKIGMVVEGEYTALSALQLSEKLKIDMPITEIIYRIIYENMKPAEAVRSLMQRTIKEEHL